MTELTFRFAVKEDVSTILYFIRQLAEYERMSNEVVATEALLEEWIFEKQKAEEVRIKNDESDWHWHDISGYRGIGYCVYGHS